MLGLWHSQAMKSMTFLDIRDFGCPMGYRCCEKNQGLPVYSQMQNENSFKCLRQLIVSSADYLSDLSISNDYAN